MRGAGAALAFASSFGLLGACSDAGGMVLDVVVA